MTLEFIVVLLMGLVGLIWVIVLVILDDHRHRLDNRQQNSSTEPHNGAVPQEGSSRQSKVAA